MKMSDAPEMRRPFCVGDLVRSPSPCTQPFNQAVESLAQTRSMHAAFDVSSVAVFVALECEILHSGFPVWLVLRL